VAAAFGALAASLKMSIQLSVALVLDVANGNTRAAVSVISEPGVEVRLTGGVNTDGCQALKLEYGTNHALYVQAEAKLDVKNFEARRFNLVDDYRSKARGVCMGKTVKRQVDNGTASDEDGNGLIDLYEDFSVPFVELGHLLGTVPFTTEFSDSQ
jgi:hypothetical protein